MTTTSRN